MRKRTRKNLRTILLCCCLVGSITALNAQSLEWARQVGGPNYDDGRAIATDAAGNVYSTGRFKQTADFDPGPGVQSLTATGTYYNTYVLKLDVTGAFVWARHFAGGGTEPKAMAVDSAGNVYITGFKGPTGGATDFDPGPGTANITITGAVSNTDVFVVKLTAAGDLAWVRQLGGTSTDQSTAITVDNGGNVYTTGYFRGTADFDPGAGINNLVAGSSSGDVFISKLDAAGNYVWAKNVGGTGASCSANNIKTDHSGNVYLSGSFGGTVDFDPGAGVQTLATVMGQFSFASNMFVCKLNPDGNYIWAKNAGASTSAAASTGVLALDHYGSLYLAGGFSDTVDFDPGPGTANLVSTLTGVSDVDIFVSKLDTGGNFIWVKQMGGIGTESGRPLVDQYGKIYLIGGFRATVDFDPSPTGTFEMNTSTTAGSLFVSRLDSAGNFEWAVSIDGAGSGLGSNGLGIALNSIDNGIHINGDFGNTVDFDPGTDTFNLIANAGGGDAFILKLKNCNVLSSIISTTACDSFSLNGTSYNLSGTYTQTFVTQNGCDSILTLQLTINNKPDAAVTQAGTTLSATTAGATYQWIKCSSGNSPVPGATQQSFTATTDGSYAVVITKNGCSDTSDCYNITITGIGDLKVDGDLKVYPNPVKDLLTITATKALYNAHLKLTGMMGQVIRMRSGITGNSLQLDMSGLASGIYILEVTAGSKVSRVKIIKE